VSSPGKFEARNPKFETNSNFKKSQYSKPILNFGPSRFELVSDFDIRISDFHSKQLAHR